MADDPIAAVQALLAQAAGSEPEGGTAATLATADASGRPSARVVLVKGIEPRGFLFFTNYDSRKARELTSNPRAALVLWWPTLQHQVRVEGRTRKLATAESDAYFATRPRGSQLGAWASRQSAELADRGELEAAYRAAEERFAGAPVPRPEFWGGYLLEPERLEIWNSRQDRLHDRRLWVRDGARWAERRLYP
jgi:pyridoxamine 5'-phosphate oxidase